MKIGKLAEPQLKRSVLSQIENKKNEVLSMAEVGGDHIRMALGEEMAAATATVSIPIYKQASLAVIKALNNFLTSGGEPVGVTVNITLPAKANETTVKNITKEIVSTAKQFHMELLGGQTELSKGVLHPIISATVFGKVCSGRVFSPGNIKPGQSIVMTKWAGIEGSVILSQNKKEMLCERYPLAYIEKAMDMEQDLCIYQEVMCLMELSNTYPVTAMHDVSYGGVFAALWELVQASSLGLEVPLKAIPMKQETIEITEYFDINPYMMAGSGSLLLVTDYGEQLAEALRDKQIEAAVIGRITDSNERVITNDGERRFLTPTRSDDLYKIF